MNERVTNSTEKIMAFRRLALGVKYNLHRQFVSNVFKQRLAGDLRNFAFELDLFLGHFTRRQVQKYRRWQKQRGLHSAWRL